MLKTPRKDVSTRMREYSNILRCHVMLRTPRNDVSVKMITLRTDL